MKVYTSAEIESGQVGMWPIVILEEMALHESEQARIVFVAALAREASRLATRERDLNATITELARRLQARKEAAVSE